MTQHAEMYECARYGGKVMDRQDTRMLLIQFETRKGMNGWLAMMRDSYASEHLNWHINQEERIVAL